LKVNLRPEAATFHSGTVTAVRKQTLACCLSGIGIGAVVVVVVLAIVKDGNGNMKVFRDENNEN
jgi:hypothetical protein